MISIEEGLATIARLAGDNQSLAVLVTTSEDPDPQVSVLNAAVMDHPTTGDAIVAFVGRPGAKLRNLRKRSRATLVFRSGWEWAAVRGDVELCGPDDPYPGIDAEARRLLLREIYHAAGGQHSDLDEYDREMISDNRCAVLVTPEHIWSNPA